jgi:predicted ATPase
MSDIVGSTRLWATDPDAMSVDLATHDQLMSAAIERHHGQTIGTAGDAFAVVFETPADAVAAALDVQSRLDDATWRSLTPIRVRIGVHLGNAQRRGDGWYGPPLNEAARIMAAAHGGQVVVSEPVVRSFDDDRSSDWMITDLGEHRLRDLDGLRRLFQIAPTGHDQTFPPLSSMANFVTTLPTQRTSLIGRGPLIAEIRRSLVDHQVVTLVGPGGVGKTRLAVEAAGRELARHSGGVYFVDLTRIRTDDEVAGAIVSGIRSITPPDVDPLDHLVADLAGRHVLIVLDNCEHVIDGVANVVSRLFERDTELRVLATSRESLRLAAESTVAVPPLAVDTTDAPGVRLLIERATDLGATITDRDLDLVAEIAAHLDGIPLALELVAAQFRTLSAHDVLVHLDDRFRMLRRGPRAAPERQQTLAATIRWSYELLDSDLRFAFRLLATCEGAFTLDTAARLLGVDRLDAANVIDTLETKSLVAAVSADLPHAGWRYLESLREFGRLLLQEHGEAEASQRALERALLPESVPDWSWFASSYMGAADSALVVEDVTRRTAAECAARAERSNEAALIFGSCAFRTSTGELEAARDLVAALTTRRQELDPLAWRSAVATQLFLDRLMRRYTDVFATAETMIATLDNDDPARWWFDMWVCALTTAVAPTIGIERIERSLPKIIELATEPPDATVTGYLTSLTTGYASVGRLDDALRVARDALNWATDGREVRDQALANLLWILITRRETGDDELLRACEHQVHDLGLAELCAAPAAICVAAPIDERVRRLTAAARRRPPTDIPTPFLLAFAVLAVECNDFDRAAELAAASELYDSSTQIALINLLSQVQDWGRDTWDQQRDAALITYLSPEQETIARRGVAKLNDEIARWDAELASRNPASSSVADTPIGLQ